MPQRTIDRIALETGGFRSIAPPLGRRERTIIVVLVAGAVVASIVLAVIRTPVDILQSVFESLVTVAFVGFVVSPTATVGILIVAMGIAFWAGSATEMLLALAIATGFVARTGSGALLSAYGGVLLLSAAAALVSADTDQLTMIVIYLLLSTVAGGVGLLLRQSRRREQRLTRELALRELAEEEIRRSERVLIADELHDVVSRDLTVIVMHSELLEREDDLAAKAQGLTAVKDAARHALRDVHRLVGLVAVDAKPLDPQTLSLKDALHRAAQDLEGGEWRLTSSIQGDIDQLAPIVDSTLARVVLESTTNAIKHGRPGPVAVEVSHRETDVEVVVRNDVGPVATDHAFSSSGYGTIRLSERLRLLGGTYRSSVQGDAWVVQAILPSH